MNTLRYASRARHIKAKPIIIMVGRHYLTSIQLTANSMRQQYIIDAAAVSLLFIDTPKKVEYSATELLDAASCVTLLLPSQMQRQP